MEEPTNLYEFAFNIDGVMALKGVIDYAIKVWPGAPARPHGEQEFLLRMRDECNRCIMEHSFHNLQADK